MKDMPKIPADQLPQFLRWMCGLPEPHDDERDPVMNELVMLVADTLHVDPENRLARTVVSVLGYDDAGDMEVAALYGGWVISGMPNPYTIPVTEDSKDVQL
jgi:hypothetical protein